MTDTAQGLKQILDAAPTGTVTYALMDGALDSTIVPTIEHSGCPAACLYGEAWQAPLRDVAPFVVELAPQAKFSSELLGWDWYANWGVFVQAPARLDAVATAMQALSVAEMPDGQEVFFRFYDPRVLRPFLAAAPSCDLSAVFAQVQRIVAPMVDDGLKGEGAVVYTWQHGALAAQKIRFTD